MYGYGIKPFTLSLIEAAITLSKNKIPLETVSKIIELGKEMLSKPIKLIDGIVWASLPNVPGKLFLKPVRSYHFADINLFWLDISENAKLRVEQWFLKNND